MDKENMVSVSEASRMLKISERHVRRYCNEGKLQCEKRGKAFLIDQDSVQALLEGPMPEKNTSQEEEMSEVDSALEDVPIEDEADSLSDNERNDCGDMEVDVEAKTSEVVESTTEFPLPKLQGDMSELFKEIRTALVQRQEKEEEYHQYLNQSIDRLEFYLRFENQRNLTVQEELSGLLKNLGVKPILSPPQEQPLKDPKKKSKLFRIILIGFALCFVLSLLDVFPFNLLPLKGVSYDLQNIFLNF